MAVFQRISRTGRFAAATGLLIIAAVAAVATTGTADAATGDCAAAARVDSQWGSGASGGQIVTVTVTNTAATGATTWSVAWTLGAGQSLVSAWNATVSVSAAAATATNASFNGSLAPGASTSFGMQLAGVAPAPTLTCTNNVVPAGSTITVTERDTQTTVTMVVGQTLVVSLGKDYRPVTLTGTALTLVSTTGGYPTGQPLRATYRAAAPGTVDLRTMTDYPCLHTTPRCALPQLQWTLRVNVAGLP
jgi:hypothetical protein